MRWKDNARSEGGSVTEQLSYPPWKIKVKPGFNPRDMDSPEVQEYVRAWAEKVCAGAWNPAFAFLVRWDGDDVWMVEGHCRQAGIALAATEEFRADFKLRTGLDPAPCVDLVKCDLTTATTNGVDDLYIPLITQEKLAITPAGWMSQIQKLIAAGQNPAIIVRKLGPMAARIITIMGADPEIQTAVETKAIGTTLAANTLRKHGQRGGAVVIKSAIAAGGGHAKPRHIAALEKPRDVAPSLCGLATAAVLAWESSGDSATLSAAMQALRDHLGAATLDAARERVKEAA